MKSALLQFENQATRDRFFGIMRELAEAMGNQQNINERQRTNAQLITKVLDEAVLDPTVDHTVALFVGGTQLQTGPLSAINKRFQEEISTHKGTVEIKERRGKEWVTIRHRRRQRV